MTEPEQRCEMTELLVSQCGCAKHRNSPEVGALKPGDYTIGAYHDAERDGVCAVNSDHFIVAGDRIGLVSAKAEPGVVTESVGWCCNKCLRSLKIPTTDLYGGPKS